MKREWRRRKERWERGGERRGGREEERGGEKERWERERGGESVKKKQVVNWSKRGTEGLIFIIPCWWFS